MKKLYLITLVVLVCSSLFGQVEQTDLYAGFQKNRPKYKKAIQQEVLTYDTLPIRAEEWTDLEFKETIFYLLNHGCMEKSTVNIYDSSDRNTVITKYFSCEKLTNQRRRIEYNDSSITYDDEADSIIFKLKYVRSGNSKTSYSLKGKRGKKVTIIDSTKTTETYYQNDTLLEKIIWFRQRNLIDTFLVFDGNNKLTTKVIEHFNKYGDIIYEERTENHENKTQVVKSKFTYVYDSNKCWTKTLINRKFLPKTDTDIVKTTLIRTLTY